MKTNHLLVMLLLGAPVLFGAVFLACGGDVAIGKGSAGLSKDGPRTRMGPRYVP